MHTKSLLLYTLFGSQTRIEILRLLLLDPEGEYYQRQMSAILGLNVMSIQRELKKLRRVNLISESKRGKQKFYKINKRSPIFEELKMIFFKTVLIADALRRYLKREKEKIEVAFIYGSFARGEEKEESDLDIFVIGAISGREMSKALREVKKTISREINFVIYTREDFKRHVEGGEHFVRSVLEDSKIFILGDPDVLKKMAG